MKKSDIYRPMMKVIFELLEKDNEAKVDEMGVFFSKKDLLNQMGNVTLG